MGVAPELEAEKGTLYDLYGVSNHMGALAGGHYIGYTKSLEDGKWYCLDDSSVEPIRNEEKIVSAKAYLLFYKRRKKGAPAPTFQGTVELAPPSYSAALAAESACVPCPPANPVDPSAPDEMIDAGDVMEANNKNSPENDEPRVSNGVEPSPPGSINSDPPPGKASLAFANTNDNDANANNDISDPSADQLMITDKESSKYNFCGGDLNSIV